MNNSLIKKMFICILVFLVIYTFVNTPVYSAQKKESQVRITWEEFKKLLKLGTAEISLSWNEFKQLMAQTGENIRTPYVIRNGRVILSRPEFSKLLDRMKPPPGIISSPPADYVISRAKYIGRVNKKSTEITADFSLQVFKKKNQAYRQIPFLPRSVALEEVLLNGRPALVTVRGGWYNITTSLTGHFNIKTRFHVLSNLEKGPQIFRLSVIRTAITLLELTLPMDEIEISIPTAKELTSSSRNGKTSIKAKLPATSYIQVNAHRKYAAKKVTDKDVPAKIYAETINLLSIEEDAVRVTSRIKLNILQNSITSITAKVPTGYNILYIYKSDGSRLRDWQIQKTDKGSVVVVPFNAPVEGNKVFTIISERLLGEKETKIDFNGYQILKAVRETGYVGAEKKSTAQASPTVTELLDRIDIKDLPYKLISMSKRPLLFGFRYLRHPFNLVMTITKHKELPTISTVIDMASVITVVLEDGKMLTKLNYKIRNTWKQFLKLDLPPDAEIWTVYVDKKRENASKSKEGKILIPLSRSLVKGEILQSFNVDIIYYSRGEPLNSYGSNVIHYPTADIMVSKMLWSVYLPVDYKYLHFSGNVEKEEIAKTFNLIFGSSRKFSLDQSDSYNRVASYLEKTKSNRQQMTKTQQYQTSNFKNSAIAQGDIAQQMRFEANLNVDFIKEQQKRLGKPGSGSNIFKIELPTSGQIYRFNKTVIEGEKIDLTFHYASRGIATLFRIIVIIIILLILFLIRRKIYKLIKNVFNRLQDFIKSHREKLTLFKTKPGLRSVLFISSILFYFISMVIFVVLVLLFIISVFRPHWLIRDLTDETPQDQGNLPGREQYKQEKKEMDEE